MSATNSSPITGGAKTRTLALVVIIALVIAALTAIDSFLENAERTELQKEARQSYAEGTRLLKAGQAARAVDALRKAHSLERENISYELGLINALMVDEKTAEAEPLMNDILESAPNDGQANLVAARLMLKKGNPTEAESYYHRAIYGEWPDNAAAYRISARMELVEFLVSTGKKQELLAELLPLEEEAGKDVSLQKRLAHLFLAAGSPSRAADIYHLLIRQNPRDAAVYEGLGEAELERGDYHAARAAFSQASLLKPGDSSLQNQLQLSKTLTALDPTPRRLPSVEKYHRSLRVLALAYADLKRCMANDPAAGTAETAQLLEQAQTAVGVGDAPAHMTNEVSEGILGVSEKIWQARVKSCGSGVSPEQEPLRLIMEKLVT